MVSGSRANMKNDDIEEMNYALSMKCPLSCMRIETPVRSKSCTHEQCFDLRVCSFPSPHSHLSRSSLRYSSFQLSVSTSLHLPELTMLQSYLDYSYQQQIWHCPVCEIGAPYKVEVESDEERRRQETRMGEEGRVKTSVG